MGGEEKVMISKRLLELRPGDVIVDLQGARHTVNAVEPWFEEDDGGAGFKVYTDTYPLGGIMSGRWYTADEVERCLFAVEEAYPNQGFAEGVADTYMKNLDI